MIKNQSFHTTKLGDVATFKRGAMSTGPFGTHGRYPVVAGGTKPTKFADTYNRNPKCITIASSGSAGYVSFWDIPILLTDAFSVDVNESLADIYFLFYFLKSIEPEIMSRATGSSVPHIYPNDVKYINLPCIAINDQKVIGNILNKIDERRNICNKLSKIIQDTIKLIYDYWFVQFDFPDENGRPYKSSGGKMVYNEKLKREIPEGWKVRNITDVASWTSGAQPPKSQHIHRPAKGYVRFIQNRDYSPSNQYRSYIPISRSNKVCDELDIMIDKYGDAGRTRYGQSGAFNVALAKISPIIGSISKEYLRSTLSSDEIYNFLHKSCMASTRASLNAELLGNVAIPIPSNEVMRHYENIAKPVISESLVLSKQSQQLAHLRDWLLPMLMNGQVRIN